MTQARPNWRKRYEDLLTSSTKKAADAEEEFLRVEQELELQIGKYNQLLKEAEELQVEFRKMRSKAYNEERRADREALNHNRALRVMDQLMGRQSTDSEPY